ncbi:hypothetical protein [uncultured Paenibacillus sp.]|uniref:hypothetical protein n=1 Tax=uncultured Paenibacillus sp. TaxID=227322 RepID=UPI0028D12139|nr:hypothetical protein [uncultured Paenibacillus sp.]
MNLKMRAKIWGMLNPMEWKREIEPYKNIVERENSIPLAVDLIVALVREMDERGQRKMAKSLQFSFAKRDARKWPETMFVKTFHSFLKQAQYDLDSKQRLILAVFQEVSPLLEDPDETIDSFIGKERDWIDRFGLWHYYWALYFHPGREAAPERWKAHSEALAEKESERKPAPIREEERQTVTETGAAAPSEERSYRRKIENLEKKLARESELRRNRDQELARQNRLIRQKEKELKQAEHQLDEQRQQTAQALKKAEEAARRLRMEEQMRKQTEAQWLADKDKLQQQLRLGNQEIDMHNQQLEHLVNENGRLRKSAAELQRALRDPDELIRVLLNRLNEDFRRIGEQLAHSQEGSSRKTQRRRMRKIIDLLDALEAYDLRDDLPHHADAEPGRFKTMSPPSPGEKADEGEKVPVYPGTFYRRDHGGYIQLDNGEVFNITESMVINHNLQHEAEVMCRPYKQESGGILYEIELLFQGDDTYSAVRQYDGYIELGEHYTWYCVALNDPKLRYPIHRKDIEIQQPVDGTPCTFNVSAESEFARLSRVYRDFTPANEQRTDAEAGRAQTAKAKRNTAAYSSKPEPFLTGCTIAILGGQRKWFEEVVTETGATLVHDTGDHPERIVSDLRRSNALFMLLTSTSHRATWEGVEIAKTNSIPHFVIQGSKSNLRQLLWDNRQQINGLEHDESKQ